MHESRSFCDSFWKREDAKDLFLFITVRGLNVMKM